MILRQLFPLLLSTPSSWCAADSNLQRPLRGASVISQPDTQSPVNAKTLHGRFLHITGMLHARPMRATLLLTLA